VGRQLHEQEMFECLAEKFRARLDVSAIGQETNRTDVEKNKPGSKNDASFGPLLVGRQKSSREGIQGDSAIVILDYFPRQKYCDLASRTPQE